MHTSFAIMKNSVSESVSLTFFCELIILSIVLHSVRWFPIFYWWSVRHQPKYRLSGRAAATSISHLLSYQYLFHIWQFLQDHRRCRRRQQLKQTKKIMLPVLFKRYVQRNRQVQRSCFFFFFFRTVWFSCNFSENSQRLTEMETQIDVLKKEIEFLKTGNREQ